MVGGCFQVVMKAREGSSIQDRCRINVLALAAVALSQVHHPYNLSFPSSPFFLSSSSPLYLSPSCLCCNSFPSCANGLLVQCWYEQAPRANADVRVCECGTTQNYFATNYAELQNALQNYLLGCFRMQNCFRHLKAVRTH